MILPWIRKTLPGILLLVLMVAIFISYSWALAEEVIKIGGTGTALGSMELLAKSFEKKHPNIKVKIFLGMGSSGGIKGVTEGAIDIGISGRALEVEELKWGISAIEYAKTPFVIVTNKDVNISGLSTEEIIKIYKGEMQTWPDGKRIRLILRPATDSDTLIIKKISPEMSKAVDITLSREGMVIASSDQENADKIEKTTGAFGFSALSLIIAEKHSLKILSYNGIAPSPKALSDGSYPLFKPLYVVIKSKPSLAVIKFIDFIRSSEGRKILEESGNLVVMGKPGQ